MNSGELSHCSIGALQNGRSKVATEYNLRLYFRKSLDQDFCTSKVGVPPLTGQEVNSRLGVPVQVLTQTMTLHLVCCPCTLWGASSAALLAHDAADSLDIVGRPIAVSPLPVEKNDHPLKPVPAPP